MSSRGLLRADDVDDDSFCNSFFTNLIYKFGLIAVYLYYFGVGPQMANLNFLLLSGNE